MNFERTPKPERSPWGPVEQACEVAAGIWFVSTPSHGGYLISEQRYRAMPANLAAFRPFNGHRLAYEEDCDCVVVVVAFPDCFVPEAVASARDLIDHMPAYFVEHGSGNRLFPFKLAR